MIIKVCGIKTEENISFLSQARIDMVGLNFYAPSVRYLPDEVNPILFDKFDVDVKRVGVFVNESPLRIFELGNKYKLDYIQLHGDEDEYFCNKIAEQFPVIKVFRIDDNFDFSMIYKYTSASYFLFDTQTRHFGGSGKKFNWEQLNQYSGKVPFLLSGGIGPDDVDQILSISHPQFVGIDINSKFESHPGIKDKTLVLPFIHSIYVDK